MREYVPTLAVWRGVDERLLELDADMADQSRWEREDWKDLVRVLHGPLTRETFGLSSTQRRAVVGGRLARLTRQYLDDPISLAAVTAGADVKTFAGAGLALVVSNTGFLFSIRRGTFIRIGGGPVLFA